MTPADTAPAVSTRLRAKRRGFNLVEAAIVLGVVGLVIGGIWVAAAQLTARRNISNTMEAVLQTVQNVRKLYNGLPIANANITLSMIRAGAIPTNFVNTSTTTKNPWNGGLYVGLSTSGNGIISITLDGLPRAPCLELFSRFTSSEHSLVADTMSGLQIQADATASITDIVNWGGCPSTTSNILNIQYSVR